MAANIEALYNVFSSFCQFGSTRNLAGSGSVSDLSGPAMDGAKWAKFCRDTGIIDKTITITDIDIMFNKVKGKTARKIDFNQFQEALRLVAAKRYGSSKSPSEAYTLLVRSITVGGARPVVQGTVPSNDQVTQRMTDHTLYTGTHKSRFDANGQGLGAAGRDQLPKTNELSKITNREQSNVRGVPLSAAAATAAPASNTASSTAKRGHQAVVTASSERLDNQANKPKKAVVPVDNSVKRSTGNLASANSGSVGSLSGRAAVSGSSGSVFDRLTDSKAYTGTHKQRFNEDGSGRGLDGRDPTPKGNGVSTYRGGNVTSLSQILRN